MGFLDKIKSNYNSRKEFKRKLRNRRLNEASDRALERATANQIIEKKAKAAYFKQTEREKIKYAQEKAKRDNMPFSLKLKKGLTQVRTRVRSSGKRQATRSNPALELPKKELFGATKSADELLGFKKKEALPKKKLKLKKKVVMEYE